MNKAEFLIIISFIQKFIITTICNVLNVLLKDYNDLPQYKVLHVLNVQ